MKKAVKFLTIITLLMLLVPQAIHAEFDADKLAKKALDAGKYGTPAEDVMQLPVYVDSPEDHQNQNPGVSVEQINKDAKEIHERVKNGTYQTEYIEPMPLQLAKKYKPVVICAINNSLLTVMLNFNELEYDIRNIFDDTM